ncbi:hypothetical protein [Kitasatospora sp. NPDC088134]|uniref:hypothetical protein n=1 Tax=Kitasatospora sp. NPDC088134 TaxID=3364071 RepID=UPI003829EF1E
MKRTKRFASWWGGGATGEDEVLVAREFDHPQYGRTACPAADLVVSWLKRSGVPAATASAKGLGGDGQLRWLSFAYIDPRLRTIGLAVAAPTRSPQRQHDARKALLAWQRTLGTRRILLPRLPAPGVPAQRGVPGLLPDPASAAQDFLDEGDSVLVLGAPTPALRNLHPDARQHVLYAEHAHALAESFLCEVDGERLSFVMAPDVVTEQAADLLRVARTHVPHLRGQHPDHWPYHASDRLNTLRLALSGADEVWLLSSPGPRHPLLDAALRHNPTPVRELRGPNDIGEHWLTLGLRTIALLTTDLTDPGDHRRHEVLTTLSGTGPLSVVTREVFTHITTDTHLPIPD